MTPELSDGNVRLTPFTEVHLSDSYVGWLNDPEVVRYSELRHSHHDLVECRAYLEDMRAGHHYFWAIHSLRLDGLHVGNITAYVDVPNLTANLTILIGDARVRGWGVGRAAWVMATDWLLGEGGLRKVYAGTMAENAPMLCLFEAAGMQVEGRLERHFQLEGREVALLYAAKFRV